MTKITMKLRALFFAAFALSATVKPWLGNNANLPTDFTFERPQYDWIDGDQRFRMWSGIGGEFLVSGDGYDKDGKIVGLYQYQSPNVGVAGPAEHWSSIIAAGTGLTSAQITDLNASFAPGATPGTIAVSGADAVLLKATRKEASLVFYSALATTFESIPGTWTLSGNSYFKSIEVSGTDLAVLKPLPNGMTIENLLQTSLNLSSAAWSPSAAVGDVTLMLDWQNWFSQNGDFLRTVGITAGVGIVIPTASKLDTSNLWAVNIGSGEAFHARGLGRVDAKFFQNLTLTGELVLNIPFDCDVKRRLKRSMSDSELFLSDAVDCRLNGGNFFRLAGYAKFATEDGSYWGRIGYQYGKKGSDTIATEASYSANGQTKRYEPMIINSARWLDESIYQNFVAAAGLDFSKHSPRLSPLLNFSLLWPTRATNVAAFKTLAVNLTVSF